MGELSLAPERAVKYRYRLLELAHKASSLPAVGVFSLRDQAAVLFKFYGIPERAFRRDCYELKTGRYFIPESRMCQYARFYNVLENDLRNYTLKQGPSVAEVVLNKEYQNSGLPVAALVTPKGPETHA